VARRGTLSAALQDVVFVVIGLVVIVFAFVVGSLGRGGDEDRAGELESELEVERRRVGELESELERLRAERS
jgi:hypothetical protein